MKVMKVLSNSSEVKISFVTLGISLLLYLISILITSSALNFFSISFLLLVSLFILRSPRGGWIFSLMIFGIVSSIIPGALSEHNGTFLIEIQERTELTGASARNSALASFFLIVTFVFYVELIKKFPAIPNNEYMEKASKIFVFFVSCIVFFFVTFCLVVYGAPLLLGISRFDYMAFVAPDWYRRAYTTIPYISLMASVAHHSRIISRKKSLTVLAASFAIMILAGEKFSLLVVTLFFFLLPYYVRNGMSVSSRALVKGGLLGVVLLVVVIVNYKITHGSIGILMPRIALQGQMPYALDNIAASARPISEIIKSFVGVSAEPGGSGIYYLMGKIAPTHIVSRMIDTGVTFTAPFPANFSYFFGRVLSPMALAIHACFTALTFALLYESVKQKRFTMTAVSVMVFFMNYLAVTMGKVESVFSPLMGLCLIFVLFVFLSPRKSRFKMSRLKLG